MTNNKIEIGNDGISIYVNLIIKSKKSGKLLASGLTAAIVLMLFYAFTQLEIDGSAVFIMLLAAVLIFIFPLRYLIWNMFGREFLILNTKSLSYQYDYGIFTSPLRTHVFDKLLVEFEQIREELGVKKGKIVFMNINKDNDLEEIIYETTVLISEEQALEIIDEFDRLFFYKYLDERGLFDPMIN